MDQVFLDASVLVSAAWNPKSVLRDLWQVRAARLFTSSLAANEARANLAAPWREQELETLLGRMTIVAFDVNPASKVPESVQLRAKDRPILGAAIALQATHLVTSDLRDFGPYFGELLCGALILHPAEYLKRKGIWRGRP